LYCEFKVKPETFNIECRIFHLDACWKLPIHLIWADECLHVTHTMIQGSAKILSPKKLLKNQYLPHLKYNFFEITFIKPYSSRAVQKYQECPNSLINFCFDLNEFSMIFFSIFNNFSTIDWNIMKPTECTLTHWEHSGNTKSAKWRAMIWEISPWQTKQNRLPCFIDRLV
jgi:hypothetical protein